MRKKQGQAAMEFLMTYGWAILVVLIAISALAYFGVLNPSRFLPESCTLVPGIACVDFKVTTTEIALVVQNGMGADLYDMNISVGDCQLECEGCWNPIDNGEKTTWKNYCSQKLGRFKEIIFIDYKKGESPIIRNKKGEIITKVKMGDFYNFEDSCGLKNGYYTNSTDFGDSEIPYCWFVGPINASCDVACENENLICADEGNNWDDKSETTADCDIMKYFTGNPGACWSVGSNAVHFPGLVGTYIYGDTGYGGLARADGITPSCSAEPGYGIERVCPCVVNN